jgi:hypothetical protein
LVSKVQPDDFGKRAGTFAVMPMAKIGLGLVEVKSAVPVMKVVLKSENNSSHGKPTNS